VVGYWPGNDEPVRGRDEYVGALQELLRRVPELTLSVQESADNGDIFIRWVARDERRRRVEHTGVDRLKVENGKVVETDLLRPRPVRAQARRRSLDLFDRRDV
jgi:hypothetical protein